MIGKTLGHYRILEKIGAGGMGEVYRARDERLERDVALKVLPAGALADEAARKRFRNEALALSKLNHPNIETVHDFDTQEGVDFLVMEHIAGETVAEKLSAGPLPEKEVAHLGLQLAEGLTAAHEQGVLHRDLKPRNLRLTPDGRLKILDFGLAKLVAVGANLSVRPPQGWEQDQGRTQGPPLQEMPTATIDEANLTSPGMVIGTVAYMAPEQLRGEKADARTDVYAAGVVLYETATGRQPFEAKVATALAADIQYKPLTPPRQLKPTISARLEEIILKCLEKDPENRYQSARELIVDLRRLMTPSAVVSALVPPRKRTGLKVAAAGLAALLLIAIALIGLNVGGWRERMLGRAGPPRIESLAVLPLENLSRDPEQEYFADGMTDALITELSKIGALKVISRTSAMQYKGAKKPLPQIARELGVDGLIEGSVLREGDQVRVTVQLIHGSSDRHLWAESYQREMRGILSLQGEVAQAIAREVRTKVSPQEQARLASARPVNPAAHEAYLKGRFHLKKDTEEGFRKGLNYFLEALQKDPEYAPAFAGIADAYLSLGNYSLLPAEETYPKAKAAALKALEIDDNLAESHLSLAEVKHVYDWDQAGAEREHRRALELSPNEAETRGNYVVYLTHMGRYDEAISEAKRAQELDPISLGPNVIVGIAFHYSRRYDEGIEQYRKVLELEPNASIALYHLARAYIKKGMYNEAITLIKKQPALYGGFPEANFLSILGVAYGFSGKKNEARSVLKSLEAKRARGFVRPYMMAENYAALGEKDRALEWLEKACDERDDWVVWLKVDPNIDRLRSESRFKALLRRIGLPP